MGNETLFHYATCSLCGFRISARSAHVLQVHADAHQRYTHSPWQIISWTAHASPINRCEEHPE